MVGTVEPVKARGRRGSRCGGGRDSSFLLDAKVLMAHVLDLIGDVAPGPEEEEREGDRVLEMVEGSRVS